MRKLFLSVSMIAGCASLRADFTYQQTTQMTGGALVEMLKMAGPFARGAGDPQISTVIVKGNRMATIRKDHTTIIDLDKDTITEIDLAKKTYTVMTFEQMKQAAENARARMQQRSPGGANQDPGAEMKFKVSAKATGQTKTVNGLSAREVVMTLETDVTDKKSGQTGAMNIVNDIWNANVPGYDEVKAFHRKMAEKMGSIVSAALPAQMGAMARPEMMQGMAEVAKEMAKTEGVPVQTVVKMTGSADDPSGAGAAPARPSRAQDARDQSSQDARAEAAAAALGRLGGLGGFGRNRNKSGDAKPAQGGSPDQGSGSASGSLMEMTTELTAFSSGPADVSKFEIPAGFKQVDPEAGRRGR
jgi:hypothetical protein